MRVMKVVKNVLSTHWDPPYKDKDITVKHNARTGEWVDEEIGLRPRITKKLKWLRIN